MKNNTEIKQITEQGDKLTRRVNQQKTNDFVAKYGGIPTAKSEPYYVSVYTGAEVRQMETEEQRRIEKTEQNARNCAFVKQRFIKTMTDGHMNSVSVIQNNNSSFIVNPVKWRMLSQPICVNFNSNNDKMTISFTRRDGHNKTEFYKDITQGLASLVGITMFYALRK